VLRQALKAAQEDGLWVPGGSDLRFSSLDRSFLPLKISRFARFEELSTFLGVDSGTDLAMHY